MTKKELRILFKDKRKRLSHHELQAISQAMLDQLLQSFDLTGKTVSLFLPIQRQREINTFPIFERLTDLNCKVAVPKVLENTNQLVHLVFSKKTELIESSWGIPEPKAGREVDVHELDIVFVPLLVCDKLGNRIGYGKGFYDTFLSTCKPSCQFIGLSHFELEDNPIEDVSSTDIPLHYCITPTNIHRFELQ